MIRDLMGANWRELSPACAAVEDAILPSPENGGPCATCAFRKGTEANKSDHTTILAALCVEGLRYFQCHESPLGLCKGFVAAINLRGTPATEGDERWSIVAGEAADILAVCIGRAREAEEAGGVLS